MTATEYVPDVKSLDWRARGAELADRAPASVAARAAELIGRLLG